MSGKDQYNFPAFAAAARRWRARGYAVTSPHEITNEVWYDRYERDFDPVVDRVKWGDQIVNEFMRRDLAAVCNVDEIVVLSGWEHSKGATLEVTLARHLGKRVLSDETGLHLNFDQQSTTQTILEEAQSLVYGPRQGAYGHPHDDYSRTATMWEAILGLPAGTIAPSTACLMMAAVKISRQVNKPKRDNMVDLAGYAACAELCVEREQQGS